LIDILHKSFLSSFFFLLPNFNPNLHIYNFLENKYYIYYTFL
jgi:hypothetical protein